jgi:activator of 2-hydroxyglutaryl-CoA dehydratase
MSGGVARNNAVRNALAKSLETEIDTDPMAQYFGAIGAALYGYRQLKKNKNNK